MHRYLPAALFLCFLGWIVFLADTARPPAFFELVRGIPLGDKLGHLVLFGVLAWLLNISARHRTLARRPMPLPLGSVIAFLLAAVEELSQLAFTARNFDLMDLAADLAGIILFSLVQWRLHLAKGNEPMACNE